MPTRVYDIDGTERSLEWLSLAWDGCEVLPARLTGGATEYWKLVAIYCTTGEVVLKVEARRGIYPADGQPAAFTYPRLNDTNPELPALPASAHNWSDRAIVQRTAASGVTGFVVNAWGPFYHAWIVSSVPSDCLSQTGMMGGTDHHGPLHGVWVLTPVAPVYATLDEALIGTCEAAQLIQFNPAAALQKAIFAAGFVPDSPEVDVQYGGISYRAQRAENLETGGVRAYYCRLDDWENVRYVVRP